MYNFRHNSKTIYNINSEIPPHRIQDKTFKYNFVEIDFIIDLDISHHVKLKHTMSFVNNAGYMMGATFQKKYMN